MNIYELFVCPLKINEDILEANPVDHWVEKENGDHCCSHCDSWNAEEFLRFCKQVHEDMNNTENVIGYSDKEENIEISRPDVKKIRHGARFISFEHLAKWMRGFDNDEKREWMKFVRNAIISSNEKKKH